MQTTFLIANITLVEHSPKLDYCTSQICKRLLPICGKIGLPVAKDGLILGKKLFSITNGDFPDCHSDKSILKGNIFRIAIIFLIHKKLSIYKEQVSICTKDTLELQKEENQFAK